MSSRLPSTSARSAPENLAILLREPFRAMTDQLIARLAATGHPEVRTAHAAVFEYLDDAGTRVSVLAERAGITKQSMTELVVHLERHGYVERAPDPQDGRARLVRATGRGREVFAIARNAMRDVQARLDARIGPERMATLRGLLEEVGRELGSPVGEGASRRP